MSSKIKYEKKSMHWPQRGFTLVELLVVVAVISILGAIILPALKNSRTAAKVVKAKAELKNIGEALFIYYQDWKAYPPAHTYCEIGTPKKTFDWAELPPELTETGYLSRKRDTDVITSHMLDPFSKGHTYKYLAPGFGYHNNDPVIEKEIWVPKDFLVGGNGPGGTSYWNQDDSPVSFAIWSVGTYGDITYNEGMDLRQPLNRDNWYSGSNRKGIIVRARPRDGTDITSP